MFDARTIRLLPEGTLLDPYKIYEVWYDATGSKVIGIGFAGLEAEELLQHRMDPIRLFLWDEMAAIDAEAAHVLGVVAPDLEDVIAASLPTMHPPTTPASAP